MSTLVNHQFSGYEEDDETKSFEGLTDAENYAYKLISSLALIAGLIVLCHQWFNRKETM